MPTTTEKLNILQRLDTKSLLAKLPELETSLEQALYDDLNWRSLNSSYLGSTSSDCSEVKAILATLLPQSEGNNAQEREAWLTRQRKENRDLSNAIAKQHDVSFLAESNHIKIDMAKKQLETMKAVLELKTAQLRFLTE